MNSKLYSQKIPFPYEMKQHLAMCLNSIGDIPKDSEGYKRNKDLQEKNTISYSQLKRIKNYFDSYRGNNEDAEFILNGGFKMKYWIEQTLNQMRLNIKMPQKHRADAGESNQFITTHDKDDSNVRPSQTHKKRLERHASSIPRITEEINKIKKLINY